VLVPEKTAGASVVTGIRHWSSSDSSTVAIDLQDQVQYEAHRLSGPDRIYFDLHETNLAPGVIKNMEVGDPLLVRVRAAQPVEGITRVVLETKGATNFSVSLEQNPYRLVVEVRSANSKPQPHARVELFAPQTEAAGAAPTQSPTVAAIAPTPPPHLAPFAPKFRIALDAGHGGWDLGTVGKHGLLEKDLVLDVVQRLGKLVESRLGAQVIYTRADDSYVPLERRTEIANLAHADLFLSIHANYSDYPSARGVETYYTNTYSSLKARMPGDGATSADVQAVRWTDVNILDKVRESRRFATNIQQSLYGGLTKSTPIPNRGVKEAGYVVLTGATMPAVLTEVSFVSSPTDEDNLQRAAYRQQIAESLYKGIAQYTQATHKVTVASAVGPKVR
jgi:N-acetylmuramoyl-L-alanine amidase